MLHMYNDGKRKDWRAKSEFGFPKLNMNIPFWKELMPDGAGFSLFTRWSEFSLSTPINDLYPRSHFISRPTADSQVPPTRFIHFPTQQIHFPVSSPLSCLTFVNVLHSFNHFSPWWWMCSRVHAITPTWIILLHFEMQRRFKSYIGLCRLV